MRIAPIGCLFFGLLGISSVALGQEREELLATPKHATDARVPSFTTYTADQLKGIITAVSGRNYAWHGYNTPEVLVVLPPSDNSVYALVDFARPELFVAGGGSISYELERGLYDHDYSTDEIRFLPENGEKPVEFANAIGTVKVRYPVQARTLFARKGEPAPNGLDLIIDGPFVHLRFTGENPLLDAASFSGIESMRAYDEAGNQLEKSPSAKFQMENGVTTETSAYWGEVAEVQVDTVDEWAALQIAYTLPPADLLPEGQAGQAPAKGSQPSATPGGKVTVDLVIETVASTVATELGLTAVEAEQRLKEIGFPEVNESLYVMSAVQGKLEAVRLFLAAGVAIDAVERGSTALVSAIQFGHFDVALFLVDAGAGVNVTDSNNCSPLFHAAGKCEATNLVRTLVEAGADPTLMSAGETTALQMAGIFNCTKNQEIIKAAL